MKITGAAFLGNNKYAEDPTLLEPVLQFVYFGSTPAKNVNFVSPTEVTAVSPEGSGTVNVTLHTIVGNSPPEPADQFTYGATLREGYPQLYDNFVKLMASPVGALGYGTLGLRTRSLEIDCASVGFGSASNEGSPVPSGRGQILAFGGQAHEPSQAYQGCLKCAPLEQEQHTCPEIRVSDEPALSSGEHGPLTTPWDLELRCGEREEEEGVPVVRIGVPEGSAPTTGCKSSAAEAAEIQSEEQQHKGCYASPAPPGCVKIALVSPPNGLEAVYEGSVTARVANGFGNGLNASRLRFRSIEPGRLHLAGNFEEAMEIGGEMRVSGEGNL